MAKIGRSKQARLKQQREERLRAEHKAEHQQQLHEEAQRSQRDAYVFEIQHMDHNNPYCRPSFLVGGVALVAFAFELYSMNNDGGTMTYVFAGILVVMLVMLWVVQRRYKAWELENGELADKSGQ